MPPEIKRNVALDVHKKSIMVSAVNGQQEVVLSPRKVGMQKFKSWSKAHLKATDAVVLEATTNVWDLYDHLEPLVARVCVAHPAKVRLIAASVVKTDKRDSLALARLLAAGMVPTIWVPPPPVRELRALVSHRRGLNKHVVSAKNRLHAILHRHNYKAPPGGLFADHNRDWWQALTLTPVEQLQVQHNLASLDHADGQLTEAKALLAQLSASETWFEPASLLIQMSGIATISAMTILSAIGNITRFPTPQQLVGYAGLGASVYASGENYYTGHITKQGRHQLRATLIASAWRATTYSPYWQARFLKQAPRIGRNKAIVAVARHILVAIWHVLTDRRLDRYADRDAIQRAFTKWAYEDRLAHSLGLTGKQFVQRAFDFLDGSEEKAALSA